MAVKGERGRDNIAITRYKTDDIARSLPTQVTRIMDIYRQSYFGIADIVICAMISKFRRTLSKLNRIVFVLYLNVKSILN